MIIRYLTPILLSAGNLEGSKIITGTKKLLEDLARVLGIFVPIVCGILLIVFAIMKASADEQDGPRWKKRMIVVIACLVIGISAGGIITLISSYYA